MKKLLLLSGLFLALFSASGQSIRDYSTKDMTDYNVWLRPFKTERKVPQVPGQTVTPKVFLGNIHVDTLASSITKKVLSMGLQTNLDQKANITDLNALLTQKADLTTLNGKVDVSTFNSALATKANSSDLALKANTTDVNAFLGFKAPSLNPTFTGTVSGITPTMVGLGNVNNTSDANKPVSIATQAALNIKLDKEVPLFVFIGESNSEGRALNSSATASELAVRPNLQIWNVTNSKFESLQIGVNNVWNNNVQFQTNKALWHGWELELANRTADRIGYLKCYLVKAGQGGSMVGQWDETTDANYIEFVSRINNAKSAIIAQGFIPKIYIFQSLGINDAISGTNATAFTNGITSFHANIRTLLGANTPIIMTQIMENNSAYTVINNAIKAISNANTYNVGVAGLSLIDANHWDYEGMKIICNRLLDVAVDNVGLPNNATGRKISIATNSSFTTTSGSAITNADVSKTIIRPINTATDWQLAPLRVEAFGNSAKFGYGYYNTTTNRFVIGAVTAGVSNDNIELAPLGSVFVNSLNSGNTTNSQLAVAGNASVNGALNIGGLTTLGVANIQSGNFQLSTANGSDQNASIVKFGNNTNSNSYGYISHDAVDNTTYFGSILNGVAHKNIVVGFMAGSKFGVGRKPVTNKFEVSGNSSFDGSVIIGGNIISNSSVLQIESTTQGFLIPRMTTSQRNAIASPAEGLEIYNLTTKTKDYFNGTVWKTILTN